MSFYISTLFLVYILIKLFVSLMQINYVKKARLGKAVLLDDISYKSAGEYLIAKESLNLFSTIAEYVIFIFWIKSGLIYLESLQFFESMALNNTLLVLVFIVANSLVTLPFDLYEKFVIDEKYGFNKSTFKLFLADSLKSFVLLVLFGGFVIWCVTLFIANFSLWWLYSFLFIFGVIVLINMLYPTLIAPMFNKMQLLEDEALSSKIEALLSQVGFKSSGVYVMDASKRDSRLNAYFGGLGKAKRVVLFDTLLKKLEDKELLAVLGHELGHFKHGDIYKNIALMGTMLFIMFFIFGHLPATLFAELGITQNPAALIILFLLFSSVLSFIMMPIIGIVSRHNEYEADKTGSELGGEENLASALQKLVSENKSFPKSHPLYIFFYYTHPPVIERLKELGVDGLE